MLAAGSNWKEDPRAVLQVLQAAADGGAEWLWCDPLGESWRSDAVRQQGVELLQQCKNQFFQPIACLVWSADDLPLLEQADMLIIPPENMQNYSLLHLLGQQGKPVILCRHPGSTVRELLYAAEHVRPLGERVFFCLGPVHTAGGPVLDLDAVAQLRQFSPVPVLAATRQRGLELAAIAAGAEGLLLEADDLNEHQITLLRHQITAMKGLCHKPAGLKSMKHPRILWE